MTILVGILAALALAADQQQLRIVVIEGEGAVNIIQQKTAVAPVVEVRDQNNLPVAGAVVRFTIAGGKHAAFAGGVAAAGAAVALTQNRNEGNEESSRPADPAVQALSGTYVMQTVNGAGLPAVTVTSPPAACAVITDNATLTLTVAGTDLNYEVIENSRTDCRIGSNESFRSNSTGTWSLSSNTITFNARSDNFLLDAATMSGTTLSMTVRPPHIEAGQEAPRINTTWRK